MAPNIFYEDKELYKKFLSLKFNILSKIFMLFQF